jgi:hypothetical protein
MKVDAVTAIADVLILDVCLRIRVGFSRHNAQSFKRPPGCVTSFVQ